MHVRVRSWRWLNARCQEPPHPYRFLAVSKVNSLLRGLGRGTSAPLPWASCPPQQTTLSGFAGSISASSADPRLATNPRANNARLPAHPTPQQQRTSAMRRASPNSRKRGRAAIAVEGDESSRASASRQSKAAPTWRHRSQIRVCGRQRGRRWPAAVAVSAVRPHQRRSGGDRHGQARTRPLMTLAHTGTALAGQRETFHAR
jgi:hypothetical protein